MKKRQTMGPSENKAKIEGQGNNARLSLQTQITNKTSIVVFSRNGNIKEAATNSQSIDALDVKAQQPRTSIRKPALKIFKIPTLDMKEIQRVTSLKIIPSTGLVFRQKATSQYHKKIP